MEELRTVRIGGLGRVVTGKTPPSARPELFGELHPFLTPTDIDGIARYIEPDRFLSPEGRDYQHRLMLPERSVCVVCIGATIGKVCMTARPSFTNQQINSVVVNEQEHDPFFVYHLMTTLRDKLKANAGGAATPIINKTVFSEIEVSIPRLPEQRRIATILSGYEDLIENNTRRIQILESKAQALYREWFVNFRFPGHAKVKLIGSPLGKIPQGWQAKNIGDVVELAYGKALKAEQRVDGPYPVYGSSGVVGLHNEALVKAPGIVVGRKGNVGSVFWSDVDFYPIDTVFFVRTEVPLHYVFYNLKHQTFLNNDAAVPPGLNRNAAYLKPFSVPDTGTLTAFQDFAEPVFSQLRILNLKNTNLRRTRDLLLPKLISGALDVSKLEIDTA